MYVTQKVRFEILFSSCDNHVRSQAENVFRNRIADFYIVGNFQFADKVHNVEDTLFGNGG